MSYNIRFGDFLENMAGVVVLVVIVVALLTYYMRSKHK